MKLCVCVIVFLSCLISIGCSGQNQQILGKWGNKELQETYEFRSDGKYEYSGSGNVQRLLGPYQIEKNFIHLTARMPSSGGQWKDETTTYEFAVEGDVLTLTKPQRSGVTYSQPSVQYSRVAQ